MKSLRWFTVCAFALSLAPSLALADDTSLAASVQHRVQDGLLKPLAAFQSRFSRGRPPPHESRVRVLSPTTTSDSAGRPFVAFAVDVNYGSQWQENDIVGCAYPKSGLLFVKIGDAYRPASFLLGKVSDAVPGVCTAAPSS